MNGSSSQTEQKQDQLQIHVKRLAYHTIRRFTKQQLPNRTYAIIKNII